MVWGALALVTVFFAFAGTASAILTTPTSGAIVNADVTIVDNQGSAGGRDCSGYPRAARIEVLSGTQLIGRWTTYSTGPWNVTWSTEDRHPDGPYTLRYLRTSEWMGWPCYQYFTEIQRFNVTLRNEPYETNVQILGPLQGYWLEDAPLLAKLTNAETGAPLAGRVLRFAFGDGVATGITGPSGIAQATLPISELPGASSVTVTFAGHSRALPSEAASAFEILPRPTLVTYEGSNGTVRGLEATFPALVTDATPRSARHGAPVPNATLRFEVDGLALSTTTGEEGRGSITARVLERYGHHAARASFGGMTGWAPDADAFDFTVRWEHVLDDRHGGGRVKLNTITREFQVFLGAREHDIRSFDGAIGAWADTIVDASPPLNALAGRRATLAYADDALQLAGAFDLGTGGFEVVVHAEGEARSLSSGPPRFYAPETPGCVETPPEPEWPLPYPPRPPIPPISGDSVCDAVKGAAA